MKCQALPVSPAPQLLRGDELIQDAYERLSKALGRETIAKNH